MAKTNKIFFKVDDEWAARINRMAEVERRNVSEICRFAIEERFVRLYPTLSDCQPETVEQEMERRPCS